MLKPETNVEAPVTFLPYSPRPVLYFVCGDKLMLFPLELR